MGQAAEAMPQQMSLQSIASMFGSTPLTTADLQKYQSAGLNLANFPSLPSVRSVPLSCSPVKLVCPMTGSFCPLTDNTVLFCGIEKPNAMWVQALPSGDLEMLLQQHPMMSSGMGRAPSFGMAKLESMELPDAVAAVVRMHSCIPASLHALYGSAYLQPRKLIFVPMGSTHIQMCMYACQ